MSELTVKELDGLVAECFRLKEQYKEARDLASDYYVKLEKAQNDCIEALMQVGKIKYTCDAGTFSYSLRESFRVPKTPADREKFFNYLKQKGVYESLITVNSTTLNSWAKADIESNMDFYYEIPGLEKSEPTYKASMLKAK